MGATFGFLATMDYHSPAVSRRGTEKSPRYYCSLTFEHLKNEYPTNCKVLQSFSISEILLYSSTTTGYNGS